MDCPTISGLRLDAEDLEAIEAIRRAQRNGNMLQIMLPAGIMTTIFLGNNSAQTVYNIHSTDWVQFADAMTHISPIIRNRIVK